MVVASGRAQVTVVKTGLLLGGEDRGTLTKTVRSMTEVRFLLKSVLLLRRLCAQDLSGRHGRP